MKRNPDSGEVKVCSRGLSRRDTSRVRVPEMVASRRDASNYGIEERVKDFTAAFAMRSRGKRRSAESCCHPSGMRNFVRRVPVVHPFGLNHRLQALTPSGVSPSGLIRITGLHDLEDGDQPCRVII